MYLLLLELGLEGRLVLFCRDVCLLLRSGRLFRARCVRYSDSGRRYRSGSGISQVNGIRKRLHQAHIQGGSCRIQTLGRATTGEADTHGTTRLRMQAERSRNRQRGFARGLLARSRGPAP
jgi:hypothetical protein